MIKGLLMAVLYLLLLAAAGFALFLGFIWLTGLRPAAQEELAVTQNRTAQMETDQAYSCLTFNIGYAGLDAAQDFFMDGGTMSRSSSRLQTETNLAAIGDFVAGAEADFVLLQEVDVRASRSYKLNQLAYLHKKMPGYAGTFAYNYQVAWVPVPWQNPMGSVKAGLFTLSRYRVDGADRFQYPGSEPWLRQLFELDRCLLATRIPVSNGRDLVLVNTHLSAFDVGGQLRRQQLGFLAEFISAEYSQGNYVLVGGDWNHVLPGTDPAKFPATEDWPDFLQTLPSELLPADFQWAADGEVPSLRTNGKPYREGENFRVVIDGFLASPNIRILSVQGHELNFAHSDHNPVSLSFALNP